MLCILASFHPAQNESPVQIRLFPIPDSLLPHNHFQVVHLPASFSFETAAGYHLRGIFDDQVMHDFFWLLRSTPAVP